MSDRPMDKWLCERGGFTYTRRYNMQRHQKAVHGMVWGQMRRNYWGQSVKVVAISLQSSGGAQKKRSL